MWWSVLFCYKKYTSGTNQDFHQFSLVWEFKRLKGIWIFIKMFPKSRKAENNKCTQHKTLTNSFPLLCFAKWTLRSSPLSFTYASLIDMSYLWQKKSCGKPCAKINYLRITLTHDWLLNVISRLQHLNEHNVLEWL